MSESVTLKNLDKRTIERHMRAGAVDDKTWEKHLKALPDVADKAIPVDSVLTAVDEDDDGDE